MPAVQQTARGTENAAAIRSFATPCSFGGGEGADCIGISAAARGLVFAFAPSCYGRPGISMDVCRSLGTGSSVVVSGRPGRQHHLHTVGISGSSPLAPTRSQDAESPRLLASGFPTFGRLGRHSSYNVSSDSGPHGSKRRMARENAPGAVTVRRGTTKCHPESASPVRAKRDKGSSPERARGTLCVRRSFAALRRLTMTPGVIREYSGDRFTHSERHRLDMKNWPAVPLLARRRDPRVQSASVQNPRRWRTAVR